MQLDFDIQNYLRISPTDMLLVCISTLLIVCIAKHFLWDKINAYIERRQTFIQENINASIQNKKEMHQLKKEYEHKLSTLHADANDILTQARLSATNTKKEMLAQANEEVLRMKQEAYEEIEKEKRAAYQELKDAMEDVALDAAEKLIGRTLDDEAHRKYVKQLLSMGEKT